MAKQVVPILDVPDEATVEELARSDARLRHAERMIGLGSWEYDLEANLITYSSGFARVMGIGELVPLTGDEHEQMVHPQDRATVRAAIAECVTTGTVQCEYRIIRADGAVRTLAVQGEADSDVDGCRRLRGAALDITDQREAERERVAALSLFAQGFDAAPIGMALTDAHTGEYFRVNDAMCTLLNRSREELMQLTIFDLTHPDHHDSDREAIRAMVAGEIEHYQTEKRYQAGSGDWVWAAVHIAPVRNADGELQAFYAQKVDISARKAREARVAEQLAGAEWLGRIRDALDDDRLVLYWQPIVDLRTGETVQRELLLRMRDENGTIVAPGNFLPVAERYGLISEIDRWVIRQAVRLAADGTPTQFNLSAASIADPDVLSELTEQIGQSSIDPALLVVEVTETAIIEQGDTGQRFAQHLAKLGCGLALDDFGTGFAGLKSLKQLPAQHLKIAMEFVREAADNETDARLVRGIVGMAREFDQITTAEGIEDERTLTKLRELGVDRGQGYFFARPRPLKENRVSAPAVRQTAPPVSAVDPVAAVRAIFRAFAERDLEAAQRLSHPDVIVRPFATAQRAHHNIAYRGHAGVERYYQDVAAVWTDLRLSLTAIWEANGAVVACGHAAGTTTDHTPVSAPALWVFRLRDGLIATVDVFEHPDERSPERHHGV